MINVAEFVRHVMPDGTRGRGRWVDCPWWPPDLFAVTALLVERTTAYTVLLDSCDRPCDLCTGQRRARLKKIAKSWRSDDWPGSGRYRSDKQYLQVLWKRIVSCQSEVCPSERASLSVASWEDWHLAALELMIVADLACAGVGFYPDKDSGERLNWIERGFLLSGFEGLGARDNDGRESAFVRQHASFSGCRFVTPAVACVQPKTRTPRVGSTLRSLSHHLSLLPPAGTVRARWNAYPMERAGSHVFNLLVLVAGVLGGGDKVTGSFHNAAATTVFSPLGNDVISFAMQKKHHRWKMDSSQVIQYSLGDALNPEIDWWENASIGNRDMMFYVFRKGACFTTLVCEDLARADPGQHVIRAIGPNIVIALLMDGPQLGARWPGRYAMSLADDPGSSVLSLTSLGLVLRSNQHYGTSSRAVGLWRDSMGDTRQLDLPVGSQALVLSLTSRCTTEYTLDGRSDGGEAYEWALSGYLPIRCDEVPSWAKH